ncbi:MAG: hypothetical protein ACK5MV_09250 [Aminipila sp.]
MILNTLIFVICSAIGYFMAQEYKCRVVNLQSFLDGLKKLEDEILYRKTPLPEALKNVSEEKDNNAAKYLFSNVSLNLGENGNHNFANIWSRYSVNLDKDFALKENDIHIISELGRGLGSTDAYGQSAVIQRACKQLESQLDEAVEANNTKGKMYKSLGIAVGLTIVIILI